MTTAREVTLRGQEAEAQPVRPEAAEAVKAAAGRAARFAAPLLRVERGFEAALLAAHARSVAAMRPVVLAGGSPDDAARAALASLRPALERLGRLWLLRALREGWAQGNARLAAAAGSRRKSASVDGRPEPESGALGAPGHHGAAWKAPRKPPVGAAFDAEWPEMSEYIASRPAAYAPAAARSTVDMFRAALAAGAEEGLGIDAIARLILGEQLPGISRYRAALIARTEVLSAGNAANLASYRASGVVARKRWLATRDDRTRETHRTWAWAKGADVVPIERPFVLPSKARLMHPGDTSLGAPLSEIVQCRCSVGPEVDLPGVPAFGR